MSKNTYITNENFKMEETDLSIDILYTDGMPYHKTPDRLAVRELAEKWVDNKCERLYVSCRDGIYRVIEGQKRTLAAKTRFVTGKKLPCLIRTDLRTEADEARWFYEINHQKRQFDEKKEGYLAKSYFDEDWQATVKTVEDVGLKVVYDGSRKDKVISCLPTLEAIYNDYQKNSSSEDFVKMFQTLNDCCLGAKESLMANFLKGFAVFYRSYSMVLDKKILKRTFSKENKKEKKNYVNVEAYKKILEDYDKYKEDYSKVGKAIATAIKCQYNKTARTKDKQLKVSAIEELDTDL